MGTFGQFNFTALAQDILFEFCCRWKYLNFWQFWQLKNLQKFWFISYLLQNSFPVSLTLLSPWYLPLHFCLLLLPSQLKLDCNLLSFIILSCTWKITQAPYQVHQQQLSSDLFVIIRILLLPIIAKGWDLVRLVFFTFWVFYSKESPYD